MFREQQILSGLEFLRHNCDTIVSGCGGGIVRDLQNEFSEVLCTVHINATEGNK
jgi:uncharacterized membrane protein YeiH